jgi:hypothetical protein
MNEMQLPASYRPINNNLLIVNWTGHVLRENCLLQHVIEGNTKEGVEVTGIQGRRRKQLLMILRQREDTVN